MAKVKVKIKRLNSDVLVPKRQTAGSVGFDLASMEDVTVRNSNADEKATIIHTGIALDIPKGYHAKVFLRSSTGLNTKLRLANGTGIIDSDYKNEILLLVENNTRQMQRVKKGERIAQFLIEKDEDVELIEVDKIAESTHKGLGSTGR